MKKKKLKLFVVCMLLILCVCSIVGCKKQNNGVQEKEEVAREIYEEPLKNYFEGLKNKDIELVYKAYPEFMRKMTIADINDIYNGYEAEYGANVTLEYEFGDAVRVKDEKDLQKLESEIKECYPEETQEFKITDAYIVTVKLSVLADTPKENIEGEQPTEGAEETTAETEHKVKKTDTEDLKVYCYEGNWYFF